jgi:hypothetical protein
MDEDQNVYLGPYLECRVERVMRTRTVRGCPKCGRDGGVTWCPDCGKLLGPIERTAPEPAVDQRAAFDATDKALAPLCRPKEVFYWAYDDRRDPPREFIIDEDDFAIDLTDNRHGPEETEWFGRAYGPEIATLRGLYGDGNLRACWGLLVWTS